MPLARQGSQFDLTLSLLLGCVPGAWLGARISSRASGGFVRRVLAFVLFASSLKLLGVSTTTTGIILCVALLVGPLAWFAIRRHHGFPALVHGRDRGTRDRGLVSSTVPGSGPDDD